MQMEESLRELLDLSIDSPDGGISYVNFKALRKLLHCIVQRLGTDIDTEDWGKTLDDRDVDASQLDEKDSESSEQQNAELGKPPSGTELSISSSDTTREERVSKCMSQIQSLLKKNQELKVVTNNLKKEMETLKDQFRQVSPVMGPMSSELGGDLDKAAETGRQSRDSICESEQQFDLQTADLRNAVQQLHEAVQNVRQDMQALKMEQRETLEKKMQDEELKDSVIRTGLSDTGEKINIPPTPRDSSTAVSDEAPSQISSAVGQHSETPASLLNAGHLQEMHKSLKAHPLVQSPESSELSEKLDIQSKDNISGNERQDMQTADHGNAVQQLFKEVQNVKKELLAIRIEQKRSSQKEMQDRELKDSVNRTGLLDTSEKINIPPTSEDSSTAVSDEAPSQISSGVGQYPETLASLQDVGHLQEMHKGLKARLERLEGEKENIQDQVNQLKTQLVQMVLADTNKISEMESLDISPESEDLDKSAETAFQSRDDTSGSEQQYDMQIADLRNFVQQLHKSVQNVKEELLAFKIEQIKTSEKGKKSKEPKDSVAGTGLPEDSSTDVSNEALSQISSGVEQNTGTSAGLPEVGHLQAMHTSLKSRVEHLEGERKHILDQVNQLKTQMIEIVKDTKKVYKTDPQVMGPESPELGAKLDKSAGTAIKSKGSISESEQQYDSQTADLRNAVQQLSKEVQNVKQELLALKMEQKRTFEKEMQDKTTELKSDMQGAIQKLQAELTKLHSTTSQQMERDMQEKIHIDHLYKAIKELEEKAEEEMNIAKGIKADMHTLETTVSTTTQQLNRMCQDLLSNTTGFEDNYHTVTKKIFRELKLNHNGIDHLQKQIVALQKAQSAENDNAAIVKKHIPVVPAMPSFPLRHPKKSVPSSNMGSERSLTETSIKQTREGDCQYEYNPNNNQLPATVGRKFRQISQYRQQQSEAELICIGTSCFKKEKQWIPEDSLPRT
ncbi:Glutamine-rich protein 2 [Bagarius yarrelli]|uniref:Glutamine-rich protein 2 n=1 Tax=Bagarius yarrelli TaxID=175774 RepID=A0A556U3L6_BAGYA|nr:Glutamine-rich protein 2 [Bagarius yarrelli]